MGYRIGIDAGSKTIKVAVLGVLDGQWNDNVLKETGDIAESQRFASAVAAIKCRGLSGRPPSAPTRKEVEDFLECNR